MLTFKRIYLFHILNIVIGGFSFAFFPIYFYLNGIPWENLIFYYFLFFLTPVLGMPLLKFFSLKIYFLLYWLNKLLLLILILFFSPQIIWPLIGFLEGSALLFFWTAFNTGYFSLVKNHGRATFSAFLFLASATLSSILPILAGLVINYFGFKNLFLLSFFISLLTLILVILLLPKEKIKFKFREAWKEIRGLRSFFFAEGMFHFGHLVVLPFFGLLYFARPTSFASYLSYLGIIGMIISLFVAISSDKLRKRKMFFIPIILLIALTMIYLFAAQNKVQWAIGAGVYSVLLYLYYPFTTAIPLDNKKSSANLWLMREWLLNAGRALMVMGLFFLSRYALLLIPLVLIVLLFICHRKKLFWESFGH